MKQHVSRRALDALWHAYLKAKDSKVKSGMLNALATIDEALDPVRVPNRVFDPRTAEMMNVPETGVGWDRFAWNDKGGGVDLDVGTAGVLKGLHMSLLDGDGYPPGSARGVKELGEALLKWTATAKKKKKPPGDEGSKD